MEEGFRAEASERKERMGSGVTAETGQTKSVISQDWWGKFLGDGRQSNGRGWNGYFAWDGRYGVRISCRASEAYPDIDLLPTNREKGPGMGPNEKQRKRRDT